MAADETVLFDTSVLIAALVEGHPAHGRCRPWLSRVAQGGARGHVNGHSLLELFAVLTALPAQPRIGPATARRLIAENVESCCQVGALTRSDYAAVVDGVTSLGLSGGVVYDAVAVRLAQKLRVDALLTLNLRDFRRVWPDDDGVIREP